MKNIVRIIYPWIAVLWFAITWIGFASVTYGVDDVLLGAALSVMPLAVVMVFRKAKALL